MLREGGASSTHGVTFVITGSSACADDDTSFQLGAGRLDHRRPFRNLGFDVGAELLRRVTDDIDAEFIERMAHGWIVERLDSGAMQRLDDRLRRSCRRYQAVPGGGIKAFNG